MVNIGLIGCGYWGPNLLRNFQECPDCNINVVAELDSSQIEYLNKKFPQIKITKNHREILEDSEIDAVAIATQPSSHYSLAKEALESNKHILVEKPMAMSVAEAQELIDIAKKNKVNIMAGHTFEYNKAIQELKNQISKGTIGSPYYIYGQRLNFGIVRQDVSSLWNLAPHDVSILIYLLEAMPEKVSCRGYDFIQKNIPDVVFMVLSFPKGIMAHVQVSWLDPRKVRCMTVVGSEKMIVYDDMADSKIQIYDKGIKKQNIDESLGPYDDYGKYQLIKQAGDVTFPKINFTEPLKDECFEFINSIKEKRAPKTDGENGLRVVKVLEAAQRSMDEGGVEITIT